MANGMGRRGHSQLFLSLVIRQLAIHPFRDGAEGVGGFRRHTLYGVLLAAVHQPTA